jgi:hypothetical protein
MHIGIKSQGGPIMQITYKGVVVEMTPQEFEDLKALGMLDHLISLILALDIPIEAVMNELIKQQPPVDEMYPTMEQYPIENIFGNFDNIDEERISNLYQSLRFLDSEEEGF